MKKQAMRPRMLFVVAPLFASSVLFAQPPADTTTAPYLDFKQFSTIAPADRIGFLDQLKWAGMKFANAPAAKRIVSLYEYSSDTIADVSCSDDRLRDHHALVVTKMIPIDSVIAALPSDAENTPALKEQLADPQKNPWITNSALQELLKNGSILPSRVTTPMPVWGELSFSNSCELQKIAANLDHDAVTWHMVDNPKLLSVIQSEPNGATPAKIIVTDSFFPKQTGMKQYFAECVPANERPFVGSSYCDAVP